MLILVTGTVCCWNFSAKETPDMERLTNEDDDSIGGGRGGDTSSLDAFADEGDASHVPRRCCTWEEVKKRPEIVLWYLGNLLSYLGFYMPFVNLVRATTAIAQSNVVVCLVGPSLLTDCAPKRVIVPFKSN